MEDSTQIVKLKPPMARNLQNPLKWIKSEPPRAHNLVKFNIRANADQMGLKFDRHLSNLRKLDRLRLINNRQDPKFHFHHQFVKNPMILCNTPL